VRQFTQENKEFSEIVVVENLHDAVEGVLAISGSSAEDAEKKAEIIGDKVLQARNKESQGMVGLKFDAEIKSTIFELMKDSLNDLNIAVIDDDEVILEQVKNTFGRTGAIVHTFLDGADFLATLDFVKYDLAFLDLNMPKVNGIEVLKVLQTRDTRYPVIILSANLQRETMLKTIQLGVRSYLIKPLKPEDIFKKSIEILKSSF
jgi:CheY-like chemotaxis protein